MPRKSNRSNSPKSRRVTRSNANRRLPTFPSPQMDLEDWLNLRQIEDRRTYHPDGPQRSPRSTISTYRLTVPNYGPPPIRSRTPVTDVIPAGVAFERPNEVLVCVRRKRRKEVLHALNKTGRGGQKSPRRTPFSDIHC